MRIGVVGTGYVGLVAGTCLAESGNHVTCVDIDETRIQMLRAGRVPIYEPGLEELIRTNVKERRLTFTTRLEEAVRNSLLIFITVGTPSDDDGSVDLTAVLAVAEGIAKAMDGYKIVITKSTVPVGTTRRIKKLISGATKHEFDVVFNPEFLKEGNAVDDFMKPDRVVIGAEGPQVGETLKELYAPFVRTGKPIIVMDIESAEMTKYAANALLATKISFMNEIANLCEEVGADVESVRGAIGADARIGSQFLFPGVGYGGSCFPKDVRALIRSGEDAGCELRIVRAVEATNTAQRERFFRKIQKHFNGQLAGKKVAVWGLAFKPGTDDMREAPAITIIELLLEHGALVHAYDPRAGEAAKSFLPGGGITYSPNCYSALEAADGLVLLTEWPEFRNPDFDKMATLMKERVVFDGRNIYDPLRMRAMGFTYHGIGRR